MEEPTFVAAPGRNLPPTDPVALRQLEEEAWNQPTKSRELYGTAHICGFPWVTVSTAQGPARRHVVPYDFVFQVFAKGRWVGKDVLSVYASELSHHTRAYYERCVREGRLQVIPKATLQKLKGTKNILRRQTKRSAEVRNEDPTISSYDASGPALPLTTVSASDLEYKLQHGDLVRHIVHRHEIPVSLGTSGIDSIEMIAVRINLYGLIVVNKPNGIPTHSTGRYHYNSAVTMLEYVLAPQRLHAWLYGKEPLLQSVVSTRKLREAEVQELYEYYRPATTTSSAHQEVPLDKLPRPCHRLDRVTSGVLLLGVSGAATARVSGALMEKTKRVERYVIELLEKVGTEEEIKNGSDSRLVSALMNQSFDVYKQYVALVQGELTFERIRSHSLDLQRDVGSASAAIAIPESFFRLHHSCLLRGVGDCFLPSDPTDRTAFPLGALVFSSVAPGSRAATLVQRLQVVPPVRDEPPATLTLCAPLTGKLHQIRRHLSQHGHPIVGDTEYAASTATLESSSGEPDSPEVLWFSWESLPAGYLAQCRSCKDSYSGTCSSEEPLCYECAGRLPLAGFTKESTSAACLHAWRYILKEELLRDNVSSQPSCESMVTFSTSSLPSWAILTGSGLPGNH